MLRWIWLGVLIASLSACQPERAQPILIGALRASPDAIHSGETGEVHFRQYLERASARDLKTIELYRADEKAMPLGEPVCALRAEDIEDKPDLLSCACSARLTGSAQPGEILLVARAEGGGASVTGPVFRLKVFPRWLPTGQTIQLAGPDLEPHWIRAEDGRRYHANKLSVRFKKEAAYADIRKALDAVEGQAFIRKPGDRGWVVKVPDTPDGSGVRSAVERLGREAVVVQAELEFEPERDDDLDRLVEDLAQMTVHSALKKASERVVECCALSGQKCAAELTVSVARGRIETGGLESRPKTAGCQKTAACLESLIKALDVSRHESLQVEKFEAAIECQGGTSYSLSFSSGMIKFGR
ncbi:MAG: hypothetical protein JXR96_27205 [Deltaproteobacteria bacterium]|nr:hypothetical protein [Deltaproteobacteria bacterium]